MALADNWDEPTGDSKAPISGKVNINTASREELMTIEGFDDAKADAIIRYREEHGAFHAVNDLLKLTEIRPDDLPKDVKNQLTV